jgi:hypothetical protein
MSIVMLAIQGVISQLSGRSSPHLVYQRQSGVRRPEESTLRHQDKWLVHHLISGYEWRKKEIYKTIEIFTHITGDIMK